MLPASSRIPIVLDRLRGEAGRLLGAPDVDFTIVHAAEREVTTVARVAVAGAPRVQTLFVKILKPKAATAEARADAAERVQREFDISARTHAAFAGSPRFAAVRPLACYPDELALVTAEARGATLLALLERRAAWWPAASAVDDLGQVVQTVGGWLRAFHDLEPSDRRFSLDAMRAYIDVRLQRLLATTPPVLDAERRTRILNYFDRVAASVPASDLREVITHADLAPSNVLVDDRTVTVIDFAMAAPGGIYMDVARLFTQLEFLTAKPKFRPAVIRQLQQHLLRGFDPELGAERPLFRLFVLQHLLCHMSNIARNPAAPLARLYNRHQLRLRQQWLETFAA